MYAGARLDFHRPLRVGEAITRVSTIADVTHKVGRTGALVFVLVRHQISNGSGLAITEEHDIVYREPSSPDSSSPVWQKAPENATWTMEICPNEVILFRYSALLFVSHRIHYDRRYVTDVEGYPGLVVHGPLIATFLLELLRQNMPSATLARFSFRALKPLYDNVPFTVSARIDDDQKTVHLWAASSEGFLAMDATVMLGDTLKG
jgi:3-methylfumaryl-CoA hydratase